ncbi:hypothetical protein [Campylobacter mucosalis]|uniref:Putative membrane protein n=1 Tax=Campylobacter mucosalis CCUG 21559 TaxID=1032067 RepID=A0A6G5QE23_9BACT|nr:hypothetical protein [Campylobacter mucosalis]QCD43874.1 putative membrane protein [Campylobacter mucosalis CCUG 21559]
MFKRNLVVKDLIQIDNEVIMTNKKLDEFFELKQNLTNLIKQIATSSDEEQVASYLKDLRVFEAKFHPLKSISNIKEFDEDKIYKLNIELLTLENSIKKLVKLLEEEVNIAKMQVSSTELLKKRALYNSFLEKEKQIFEIYESINTFKNNEFALIHNINAMRFDLEKTYKRSRRFLFSISTIFAALLCLPYFIFINKIPSVAIDDISFSLFMILPVGFFVIVYAGFVFIQNFILFRIFKEHDRFFNHIFVFLYNFFLFFLLILPFTRYFDTGALCTLIFMQVFVSISFVCYITFYTQKILFSIFLVSITIFVDLLPIFAVYFVFDEINISYICLFFTILFISRLISNYKIFLYRIQFALSLMLLSLILVFLNRDFVRLADIANYNADYVIPTKFIPSYVLNLKPNCSQTKVIKFDENLTKLENIKVVVKSDEKYFLKIEQKPFECVRYDKFSVKCEQTVLELENLDCKKKNDKLLCEYKEFDVHQRNIFN